MTQGGSTSLLLAATRPAARPPPPEPRTAFATRQPILARRRRLSPAEVARCQGLLLPWAQDPEIIVVEKFDKQLAIRLSGVHPYGAFADHRCVCNMNAVRSIESLAAGDGQHNLFRTLGPTLLISMAYIDLGKWLVAVDAGSQVWVRSCATGVAVQFLSHFMSISVNLYQHGHREKSCRGVAVGFNLVFEHDDLITAICIASVVVNLLPYTLSRLVQRRSSVLTLGSLFHDHLFSILFIFTGIFLVNYILLSSAADESSATMVMNFQDAMELMHQIFTNPAAPIVLLVILLFSSHIISLTCIVSSDVISENFFGIKLPLSAHHLLPKGFAMILTICCAKVAGPGGIYQSLIMCPVIQAMLLPSSIIPILRVSSSTLLMGRYRVSLYVEILAFFAFLLALFTNIIFAAEILFGDSTWTNNLKGDAGSPVILPYSVLVLISCASIAFTLFLAVTPLKSAIINPEVQPSLTHKEPNSVGANWTEHVPEVCSASIVDHSKAQSFVMRRSNEKALEVEADVYTKKDT
ncbi:uncharacterized protein C2845_PM02G01610 [Panicum miliaceum]|uniref:Ethylene-insensitive protein 2 n=1 Tax=Panicum miliaceum TaxID=4540 RepID=A0A3L6S9T4_PANMI|nr:uncharacterized protein C2845_PM02G01610 [Panicum miliaceum]